MFDKTKYVRSDLQKFLFENLIKQWLDLKGKEGIATIYKYEQFNRDYFIFFKGQDVREIRTSHVHEFYHQLPERLNNKTKKNILGALHAFFKWLLVIEHVEKMPVFPKIEVITPDWQWLDEDDQNEILSAIPENDRHIYTFLALHGCRPAEVMALKIKDLDFTHNSVIIRRTFSGKSHNILVEHTKTKKTRVIPINPLMIDTIKKLCKGRFGEDFVFLNPRTGKYYCKSAYWEIWNKARKSVGKNIKSYEALRHSFASQRVCMGYDLLRIGKILGHTDSRTTQRYSHVNLESLRGIMDITPVSGASSDVNNSKK
ncbi:MAG: tyrosine-type recombinase/integrase [Nitrospirae bacterium]|nr:tyrosine-type recombinase/integrase [Nitrospirota bacterium]